jgi:hypothetical protein
LSWATNEEHETAGLVAQVLDASSVTRPAHLEQPGYTTVSLRLYPKTAKFSNTWAQAN